MLYWQPIGSRTWAFQRTHYETHKIQDVGDPPSRILTPKCKNAIFWKTKQFKVMVSMRTYRKLCNWAFQRTHYWIPKTQDGLDPPFWKSIWRRFFYQGWLDLDKISETGAEWHVYCGDVVEIKTRCGIPIWRRLGNFGGMSSQSHCHIAWCCHLVNSLPRFQSHMPHCRVQSPGDINVMIVPHCRV